MMKIKKSKPISKIKKGDKIKVDDKTYDVDAHYVLISHGSTKEMCIELFDSKAKEGEGDYQMRYFDDQIDNTIKFYVLKDIVYENVEVEKVEW